MSVLNEKRCKIHSGMDTMYADLKPHINTTTKYYIYGDIHIDKMKDHLHHISHCENINIYPNVILNTKYEVDLKRLRDKGVLKTIIDSSLV